MRIRATRALGTLALAASLAWLGAASASAGPNAREARQRGRIAEGIQDGSLTRGEAARLGREQARIERRERRFRRDDGHLGPRERARLDRSLDRSARHIGRARHDARER
jgi:hypothetical protein